jgi:hypothetical protein
VASRYVSSKVKQFGLNPITDWSDATWPRNAHESNFVGESRVMPPQELPGEQPVS